MGYFKDEATKKMIDPAKSRKGKNSRQRGNAFEREVAKRLLGQRVGQFGGKQDVANDWLAVQCKVGGSFQRAPVGLVADCACQKRSVAWLGDR